MGRWQLAPENGTQPGFSKAQDGPLKTLGPGRRVEASYPFQIWDVFVGQGPVFGDPEHFATPGIQLYDAAGECAVSGMPDDHTPSAFPNLRCKERIIDFRMDMPAL